MLFSKKYISQIIHNRLLIIIVYYLQVVSFVILTMVCYLPLFDIVVRYYKHGTVGFFLRGVYYKNRLKRMGQDVFIDCGVSINNPKDVFIGHNVYLDENVIVRTTEGRLIIHDFVRLATGTYIQAGGTVVFKDYSATSSYCRIYSQTHYYTDGEDVLVQSSMADRKQNIMKKLIVIGEGALLGTNVTLLPQAMIGDYSTIGAHSLVDKEIPAYCVAVGCPAVVIKENINVKVSD